MKNNHKKLILSSSLITAAFAGLLSASAFADMPSNSRVGILSIVSRAEMAGTRAYSATETEAGKNECKGKGGCKSGDNGCKGKNSCKGKGGCKTTAE